MTNDQTRAKALQLHIEDLLLLMNASRVKKDRPQYGGYKLPLAHFSHVHSLAMPQVTHGDYGDMITTEATLADLGRNLDITLASPINPLPGKESFGETFGTRRYRTVQRPSTRVQQMTRFIVEESRLFINRTNGEARTSLRYYGTNNDTAPARQENGANSAEWFDLQQGCRLDKSVIQMMEMAALSTAMGYQFGLDYHWHVRLKWTGADVGIVLPTTPSGAKALFKLRDVEPGNKRRSALRTWISEHSRRIRRDTTEESVTTVREHLRGASSFRWQDMEGEVMPSSFDLRRVEAAKAA